ncbi:MAG: hypothetical protein ACP5F1_06885, partial [Thermoplasmata archaeon]
ERRENLRFLLKKNSEPQNHSWCWSRVFTGHPVPSGSISCTIYLFFSILPTKRVKEERKEKSHRSEIEEILIPNHIL